MSESNKVGSWKLIGYVAPGAKSASEEGSTTNFKYVAGSPAVDGDASAITGYSDTKVWGAANLVALNDCAIQASPALASANWSIAITANSNGNSVSYKAAVSNDCQQLTPTFDKIGK